ncbi:hypothetical protein V5799_007193 [Amblyomma americanum]|uniref:Uncharacterized protein n=1 Tax=Amblyomma americanum TaxID=6943 RepID=A0AAQ4DU89_AMBAM
MKIKEDKSNTRLDFILKEVFAPYEILLLKRSFLFGEGSCGGVLACAAAALSSTPLDQRDTSTTVPLPARATN